MDLEVIFPMKYSKKPCSEDIDILKSEFDIKTEDFASLDKIKQKENLNSLTYFEIANLFLKQK